MSAEFWSLFSTWGLTKPASQLAGLIIPEASITPKLPPPPPTQTKVADYSESKLSIRVIIAYIYWALAISLKQWLISFNPPKEYNEIDIIPILQTGDEGKQLCLLHVYRFSPPRLSCHLACSLIPMQPEVCKLHHLGPLTSWFPIQQVEGRQWRRESWRKGNRASSGLPCSCSCRHLQPPAYLRSPSPTVCLFRCFTEGQLTHSSGVQQSDSIIHTFFQILFRYKLLLDTE